MADTIRTRAAIISLLPDNTTLDISPQDLRDTVVSAWGVFGSIYTADASAAQAGVNATPALLTLFAANGQYVGLTPDYTTDTLTVPAGCDGTYLAQFSCTFQSSVAGSTVQFHLRKNGSEVAEASAGCICEISSDKANVSFCNFVTAVSGDVFTVYVEADSTISLTVKDAQLSMLRIY